MPVTISTIIVIMLIVCLLAMIMIACFGWISRRGGGEAIIDVTEELHDAAHAVAFQVVQSAQRTIHEIRGIIVDRRIIVRAALYIVCASLMALLWLLLGSRVALVFEPAAVAFIKHGGEIATFKLHLYWNIRMAFGIVGFLLGMVVGEGVYILLRPLIKPQ